MKQISKEEKVDQLKTAFKQATAVVFADYKGVTSEELNSLRRSMRDKKVLVRVAKNNLVRVALKGTEMEKAVENLAGPTITCFAMGDAVEMAKGVSDFAKKVEAFTIKEGFLGTQSVTEAQIKHLASLPSRDQLLGQLLSVMNGPIRNFVTVLNAVQRDFTRVLQAVADQKGKQG